MNLEIMSFPFEQIGWGLRQLSLSGTAGNIVAIIIYVCFCLIPCFIYLVLIKKKKAYKLDLFLPIISILLFGLIYYMINPGLLQLTLLEMGKAALCCTFDSVVIGYLVLRVMKIFMVAGADKLKKGIRIFLWCLIVVFVLLIGYELVVELPTRWKDYEENYLGWFNSAPSYIIIVLRSVVTVIPFALDILVIFNGVKVLDKLLTDAYSDEVVLLSERLLEFCVQILNITVVLNIVFNLVQILCHPYLYKIHIDLVIPFISVGFILGVILLVRYIGENKKLKQDNDLFI